MEVDCGFLLVILKLTYFFHIVSLKASRRRDRVTGLDTVQYNIESTTELLIEASPVTIVNIHLDCKLELTPWCVPPDQLQSMMDKLTAELTYQEAKTIESALVQHGFPVSLRIWKQE